VVAVTCSIDGCAKKVVARGWCGMHYERWRQHGDPTFRLRAYGSGRRVTAAGYVEVWCPGHPCAMTHGYALEHRKVMHDLGFVVDGMEVHHVDRNRQNNDPANLELLAPGEHQRMHAAVYGVSNQHGHFGGRSAWAGTGC